MLGFFFGTLMHGIGVSWWKATHNVHHVATNKAHADPDVQYLPLFSLDKYFFKKGGVWSTYHEKM